MHVKEKTRSSYKEQEKFEAAKEASSRKQEDRQYNDQQKTGQTMIY